jgi:hypothetical protein
LDIHAITELRDQNVPLTDDSPKYNYRAKSEDKDAEYGKYLLWLIIFMSSKLCAKWSVKDWSV